MKKVLFLTVMAYCSPNLAKAQSRVYFELGGPGLASFNFDTQVYRPE